MAVTVDVLGLASLAEGLVDKIPTGKGKRKMAAQFLNASAKDLALLRGDLEMAANAGEVLGGFTLRMLSSRLGSIQSTMETTVVAIGPDDIAEDESK